MVSRDPSFQETIKIPGETAGCCKAMVENNGEATPIILCAPLLVSNGFDFTTGHIFKCFQGPDKQMEVEGGSTSCSFRDQTLARTVHRPTFTAST